MGNQKPYWEEAHLAPTVSKNTQWAPEKALAGTTLRSPDEKVEVLDNEDVTQVVKLTGMT